MVKDRFLSTDWLRNVVYIALAAFLVSRILASVQKLNENKMSFDAVARDSPTLLYPSLTMCPSNNTPSPEYNVTADYVRIKRRFGPEQVIQSFNFNLSFLVSYAKISTVHFA